MTFKDLRESLIKLKFPDYEKTERQTIPRLDISGQFGGTPNFMLAPPKEQLVEKYFHPDNISSLEKPKHELQKVRDEFKMSASDCGSACGQAQQQSWFAIVDKSKLHDECSESEEDGYLFNDL